MSNSDLVPVYHSLELTIEKPSIAVDLVGLALAGLCPTSQAAYRKDYVAYAHYVYDLMGSPHGPTSEHAIRALIRLGPGNAYTLVMGWVGNQLAGGIAPATVRRRAAALKRAVQRARKAGLTTLQLELDLPKAEAFRDTAGPGKRGWLKILARAEADAEASIERPPLVRARAWRNLGILLLLHDRALRRSEVSMLEFEDFDPNSPRVQVQGKGKTAKEWLTVSSRSWEAVAFWVAIRGNEPGPLFIHLHNGRKTEGRLTDWSINQVVKRMARRAGLSRTVTAHALRHQAITEALTHWDVRDVRLFSRHKKIDTVLVYDDRRKDMGGRISDGLGGGRRKR